MPDVRIAIGSDHAGFVLKERLAEHLRGAGHQIIDFGTRSTEPVDYPDFCGPAAQAVADGRADAGVVLGGSGQGEQIVANKVHGVRAALCNDPTTARLAREHNDANVISIGARLVDPGDAVHILDVFLQTAFEGGRHVARLAKIAAIESAGRSPAGRPTGLDL